MTNKLADTFNEYGTPVTLFLCSGCNTTFTVCPAVPDDALDQWTGCLAETCSTYDPARDADKLFDEGKAYRTGDRSHLRVIEGGAGRKSAVISFAGICRQQATARAARAVKFSAPTLPVAGDLNPSTTGISPLEGEMNQTLEDFQ